MCSCCRTDLSYAATLSVRMQDLADDDSGIDIQEQGNGSLGSNSDSSSSDSGSDPNLASVEDDALLGGDDAGPEVVVSGETDEEQLLPMAQQGVDGSSPHSIPVGSRSHSAQSQLTAAVQVFMLKYIARPVMYVQLVEIRSLLLRILARPALIYVFVVFCATSFGGMVQLEPASHAPQFFDPDSNIQKMIDLAGNLTDSDTASCHDCSNWNPGGRSGFTVYISSAVGAGLNLRV